MSTPYDELIQQLDDAGVLATWIDDQTIALQFASGRTFELQTSYADSAIEVREISRVADSETVPAFEFGGLVPAVLARLAVPEPATPGWADTLRDLLAWFRR